MRARPAAFPALALMVWAVFATGAQASAPAGDWWDTAYLYRQKLTLSAAAAGLPAGVPVSFVFDHAALVSAGKSQPDGDDIRIAYWDGGDWTEVSRALADGSSWDAANTRVMFKTQAAVAGGASDDNYYLYYGNAAATAPAPGIAARWYKSEQLSEQGTTSASFVDVPGTTLTFTPGDASETWLVFVSGVMRSSSTGETDAEMRLLINGVEVDYWGHQVNNANLPNGAGFITFERITGTTALQTVQPQFRAAAGTTYADDIRVVAALVPPNGDVQFAETDGIQQRTGSNLELHSLSFTPSSGGDYLILGKLSQRESPSGSTVQGWLEDDGGTLHPDAPAGTRFSNARGAWQPLFVSFRRTLPASARTFRLRGTSSGGGGQPSEWRYCRIAAVRTDTWEAAEYSESLGQSTTTLTTYQEKNALTTAAPPAARDYLIIQAARIAGSSTATSAQKSGELRDDGVALVRTNHHINRDNTAAQGYHHVVGVANAKNTAAAVTYSNGFLSPSSTTVDCAESTIIALRYHEADAALGSEEPVPTVTFTSGSQNVPEAAADVAITVQLSAVSAHDVIVPFTVGGTAGNGSDYTITGSPATISAGTLTATITISVLADSFDEEDETVIVTMQTPTGAVPGATTVHTATILDDDTAGVGITQTDGSTDVAEGGATDSYTVVLTSEPTADVTITVDPDGQTDVGAGPGVSIDLTFTGANWNVPQTVTVTAVDDAVAEGVHTSSIAHSAASADPVYNGIAVLAVVASITDDDTAGVEISESGGSTGVVEGGATDTYEVVLRSEPTGDVTITVDPDGQTDVGAGPGVSIDLTFTSADWNVPQTVTVAAVDDAVAEGVHDSVVVHSAASTDAHYDGIGIASVTVHITDNGTAGVEISESGGSTGVVEGGGSDSYTVVLTSEPTGDVTITVDPDGQTDVGAGPGVSIDLTFTGADWNVPQTVTVTAVDDPDIEGPHSSTITHAAVSADTNYNGGLPAVAVAVTDNDVAQVAILQTGGSTAVTEGGPPDTYAVVLLSRPAANVVVQVSPDPRTDVGAGPGVAITLTFTPANWNVAQNVSVSVPNDLLGNRGYVFRIGHTVSSADPDYNGLPVPDLTVQVFEGATGPPPFDADGDGFGADTDNCPDRFNPDQTDSDGDGAGDACDECPRNPNVIHAGACGCDGSPEDTDGDGIPDCADTCPQLYNPDQADTDRDGAGDPCDHCPEDPRKVEPGLCGCGAVELDTDGDGQVDGCDLCPADPDKYEPGVCGCGLSDVDSDGDGFADCVDNCPAVVNMYQHDTDGDGVGDACDEDGPRFGLCGVGLFGGGAAGTAPLMGFGLAAMRLVRRRLPGCRL